MLVKLLKIVLPTLRLQVITDPVEILLQQHFHAIKLDLMSFLWQAVNQISIETFAAYFTGLKVFYTESR